MVYSYYYIAIVETLLSCLALLIDSQHHMIVLFASSKQRDLYDETFRDLVQAVLDGFNGTIFAYGQTGTGKTFTMQGAATVCFVS